MTSRLEYALSLAKRGFRIFPLVPLTKEPYLTEKWKEIRTTDEATIRRWFSERPDMNYAVNPGDDQVIMDLDEGKHKDGSPKRGILNFGELETKSADFDDAKFDDTFVVATPRGGLHGYFDHCPHSYAISVGTETHGIVRDVDVRGPDGYVVGPGCVTADAPERNTVAGEYKVLTSLEELKPLPGWLGKKLDEAVGTTHARDKNVSVAVVELDTPQNIKRAIDVLRHRKPAIEGEGGNHHTYATIAHLKDEGVSEDKCVELICNEVIFPPNAEYPNGRTWNQTCLPEWEDYEITHLAYNVYRYGNRRPGAKADMLAAVGTSSEEIEGALEDGEFISAVEQPGAEDPLANIRENKFRGAQAFMDRVVNTDMLAPEYIPAFGYTAIKAKRGTGKTVFMYDLANRLACDMIWHNNIPLDKGWAVVYLCGEDDIGLQLHMQAWCKEHGKVPAPDRLTVYTLTPDLMSGTDVENWAKDIRSTVGDRRVVTFVDTWQRATSRASQNDDKEMQTAIHNAQALAKVLNGPMIIACHPPKSNADTISGSMVIENHSTCIIHITDEGLRKRATVERIKGPGERNFIGLEYKLVDLGRTDKFDKKVTGLVPYAKGGTGMGVDQAYFAELMEIAELIYKELHVQITDNKGSMAMKDMAAWLINYGHNYPATRIGAFAANMDEEEEALKRLRSVFPIGIPVQVDDTARLIADEKKIKLLGEAPNPTSSPEVSEGWESGKS
jgi:hypothetical protein